MKTIKKPVSILLSLIMVFSLFTIVPLTAYADNSYTSLKNTPTVVHFDSKDWYLIDYDASTVTLLAKECVGASHYSDYEDEEEGCVVFVEYSYSTAKTVVDTYYSTNISTAAKGAVIDGGMFLLTYDQANALNTNVLKCSKAAGAGAPYWWLCSGWYDSALYVDGNYGNVDGNGYGVDETLGVRPALKLDLSKVTFASVNLSGGANATPSGASSIINTCFLNNTVPAMTDVTYTANEGYTFPATSDYYTTTNGITVTRTSDTVVTVSGTPTDVANVTVPDAYLSTPAAPEPTYTVTWNNWDNSLLDTDTDVAEGSTPTYDGAAPTKADDAQYTYTFSGWNDGMTTYGLSDTLPNVTADVTYTATFEATPISASAEVDDVLLEEEYLTFTAEEANSSVRIGVASGSLQYKKNDSGWQSYTEGTQITLANVGDYVRFHGTDTTFDEGNRVRLTGEVACSGNVMSLRLDNTGRSQGLAESCYCEMFYRCEGLTTAPELPATTLAEGCYERMFEECTSLTTAPALPATTLAAGCYESMFENCTSLTTAPALPATTLAAGCYSSMFAGCESLTTAPALPATTLAEGCYSFMFDNCSNLTTAPALPATTLESECYYCMFENCTSLTTAPALPATTLAESCYCEMFYGCEGLTTPPALPATTLAESCYYEMFCGCTSLTTPPALPATTLESECYCGMFCGCSGIKLSEEQTAEYSIPYSVPSGGTGTDASGDALDDMFEDTGGTFTGTPEINETYYLAVTPHDYQSVSITDQIGMNLFLDLDNRNVDVNDVTITVGGSPVTVTGTKVTEGDYKDLYQYTIVMAPAQTATLIGVVIGGETILSTSVQSYCTELATMPEYASATALLALTSSILTYGETADAYFNNTAMDATVSSDAAGWTRVFNDQTGYVTSASFMALTKPEFRFYTADLSEADAYDLNSTITVAYSGTPSGSDELHARFVKDPADNVLLEVTGVSAENMDQTIVVTIGGQTLTFAGNDFAQALAAYVGNPKIANLGNALYNYGVAAKAYFG